jgi:hypothetical protein
LAEKAWFSVKHAFSGVVGVIYKKEKTEIREKQRTTKRKESIANEKWKVRSVGGRRVEG